MDRSGSDNHPPPQPPQPAGQYSEGELQLILSILQETRRLKEEERRLREVQLQVMQMASSGGGGGGGGGSTSAGQQQLAVLNSNNNNNNNNNNNINNNNSNNTNTNISSHNIQNSHSGVSPLFSLAEEDEFLRQLLADSIASMAMQTPTTTTSARLQPALLTQQQQQFTGIGGGGGAPSIINTLFHPAFNTQNNNTTTTTAAAAAAGSIASNHHRNSIPPTTIPSSSTSNTSFSTSPAHPQALHHQYNHQHNHGIPLTFNNNTSPVMSHPIMSTPSSGGGDLALLPLSIMTTTTSSSSSSSSVAAGASGSVTSKKLPSPIRTFVKPVRSLSGGPASSQTTNTIPPHNQQQQPLSATSSSMTPHLEVFRQAAARGSNRRKTHEETFACFRCSSDIGTVFLRGKQDVFDGGFHVQVYCTTCCENAGISLNNNNNNGGGGSPGSGGGGGAVSPSFNNSSNNNSYLQSNYSYAAASSSSHPLTHAVSASSMISSSRSSFAAASGPTGGGLPGPNSAAGSAAGSRQDLSTTSALFGGSLGNLNANLSSLNMNRRGSEMSVSSMTTTGEKTTTNTTTTSSSKKRPRENLPEMVECDACKSVLGCGGVRAGPLPTSTTIATPTSSNNNNRSISSPRSLMMMYDDLSPTTSSASNPSPPSTIPPPSLALNADFAVEFVCGSCAAKYMFCSECGGGGKRTGKWRPRQMFSGKRRTCSLPHIRVGDARVHYRTMELPREALDGAALAGIKDVYWDSLLSMLSVPQLMESSRYNTYETLMQEIEKSWHETLQLVHTDAIISPYSAGLISSSTPPPPPSFGMGVDDENLLMEGILLSTDLPLSATTPSTATSYSPTSTSNLRRYVTVAWIKKPHRYNKPVGGGGDKSSGTAVASTAQPTVNPTAGEGVPWLARLALEGTVASSAASSSSTSNAIEGVVVQSSSSSSSSTITFTAKNNKTATSSSSTSTAAITQSTTITAADDKCFVSFAISEWDRSANSLLMMQMAPRSVYSSAIDTYGELIRRGVERVQADARRDNAPPLQHIWMWNRSEHTRLLAISERLKFVSREQYLLDRPTVPRSVFERRMFPVLEQEGVIVYAAAAKPFLNMMNVKSRRAREDEEDSRYSE